MSYIEMEPLQDVYLNTDIEIDFSSDGVTLEQANDKAERTNTLDELLEAVKKNEI